MLLFAVVGIVTLQDEPATGTALLVIGVFFGGLQLAVGIGLLKLRPWARGIEIGLSIVGLLNFPFGTVIGALILVYLFRPEAKLLFSGRPVAELGPQELAALTRRTDSATVVIVGAAVALMLVVMIGIVAAIAIPNLLNAIHRGRQKRTMADMRTIATAIGTYDVDHDRYPAGVGSIDDLEGSVVPTYIKRLPRVDGWENTFEIATAEDGSSFEIVSLGRDGEPGVRDGGGTTLFDCDIVFRDGMFWQWPEGLRRD
jgi:general secretion pathway protein G